MNCTQIHHKAKFWKVIKFFFPAYDWDTTVMVFGSKIYSKREVEGPLLAHEMTHVKQQKNLFGAMKWWILYTVSDKYRYKQELEAYRNQYFAILREQTHKQYKAACLRQIAEDLSGPLYNNIVSYEQAVKAITHS